MGVSLESFVTGFWAIITIVRILLSYYTVSNKL
jgi:hypothetical protein